MYAPLAAATPALRAADGPALVWLSTRTRASPSPRTRATESSLLPSSTTITSKSASVCARTLRTAALDVGGAVVAGDDDTDERHEGLAENTTDRAGATPPDHARR